MLLEPLQDMLGRSKLLVPDFSKIPENTPKELAKTNARYLVGQYAEDRIAMLADTPAGTEGRTIHMGIDVFATALEIVRSPCDGEIVRSGYEAGFGECGYYIIL